jgi:hypothetical protein
VSRPVAGAGVGNYFYLSHIQMLFQSDDGPLTFCQKNFVHKLFIAVTVNLDRT